MSSNPLEQYMDRLMGDMMEDIRSQDPDIRRKAIRAKKLSAALLATNAGLAGSNVGLKIWDAIIGPVPLYMITYYDFAESDSIVKYRAFGGEFFAHQGGDKTALRVDFLLIGPEKEAWINALRMLRLMCKTTTRGNTLTHQDESYLFDPVNARGQGLWRFKRIRRRRALYQPDRGASSDEHQVIHLASTRGVTRNSSPEDIATLAEDTGVTPGDVISILEGRYVAREDPDTETGFTESDFFGLEPASQVDPLSIKKVMTTDDEMTGFTGEYESHSQDYYQMQQLGYYSYNFNFPVIIDNLIFTDMWLETVQFTADSKNGVDAIVGHLLLRKYIKPPRIRWTANGRNPSALQGADIEGNNDFQRRRAIDKWLWVWQDKQSPVPQFIDYGIGVAIGIAKAAIRFKTNPYKYIGGGLFQKQVRSVRASVSI